MTKKLGKGEFLRNVKSQQLSFIEIAVQCLRTNVYY